MSVVSHLFLLPSLALDIPLLSSFSSHLFFLTSLSLGISFSCQFFPGTFLSVKFSFFGHVPSWQFCLSASLCLIIFLFKPSLSLDLFFSLDISVTWHLFLFSSPFSGISFSEGPFSSLFVASLFLHISFFCRLHLTSLFLWHLLCLASLCLRSPFFCTLVACHHSFLTSLSLEASFLFTSLSLHYFS